jgi:RNA polymerase sigma-70 factor (ECF subfamily)
MGEGSSLQTSPSLLGRLRDTPDDQSAWAEFVGRYRPRLLDWCRRWGLQDADAQDVCQTVMVRLAAKLRVLVYDPAQSFRGWLHTLARHAWSDFVTDRQKRAAATDATAALHSVQARDDLETRLADAFDLELLEEATARVRKRVEEKTWEAFRRTALLGETAAAAAAALGMPVASVFKAKNNVQKWLQEEVRRLDAPAAGRDP